MNNGYIRQLAKDYIDTITALASGMYGDDEVRYMEQQRSVLHDQLVAAIGKRIRRDDMPQYARSLLR